jgi:hypothetical protein
MSTLDGAATSAGSSGTPPATGASNNPSSAANTGTADVSSLLSQDLQQVAASLNSMASAMGTSPSGMTGTRFGPPPPRPGPPPDGSDISNTGTVSAGANSDISNTGTNSPGSTANNGWETFMQQFAVSAYSSGNMAALSSGATSSLASIDV